MTAKEKARSQAVLDKLCEELGSPYQLSKLLNIGCQAVIEWLRGEKEIPILRAFDIDILTKGKYSAGLLRPDLKDKYHIESIYNRELDISSAE